MNLRYVTPSFGKAGHITTLKFFPNTTLVVPANQIDLYKNLHPDNEIIPEPDGVKGIVQCRQFILDHFKDENIFMVDDDVREVRQNYEAKQTLIYDTAHIDSIVKNIAEIAIQTGAYLFGFGAIMMPVQYQCHEPIRTTGWINNSYMGFLKGHNLKYNTSMMEGEDFYISCLNKFLNRIHILETRYSIVTDKNFSSTSGCANYRNQETMIKTTKYLQKLFGSTVVTLKTANGGKKKVNYGERCLRLPF